MPFTAETWPIAAAALALGSVDSTGSPIHDAPVEEWMRHMRLVREQGFTELDPTDTWVRVADLEKPRLHEFKEALAEVGLTVPAISTSRRNLIDEEMGAHWVEYGHRLIDVGADLGAQVVSFGFFTDFTEAQKKALWFWLAEGYHTPDDPEHRALAASRVRELAVHGAEVGVQVSLEMYEDTYVGTSTDAVQFLEEVGHDNVGLNPDIANFIRLHRPMENIQEMFTRLLPHTNFWHVKNYLRDEDPATGAIFSAPVPMEIGLINYRSAIAQALRLGFGGPFLCEHYGGDGLGVIGMNRAYVRGILRSHLADSV